MGQKPVDFKAIRDDTSGVTSIPPDPRALHEKFLKRTKVYQKNQAERGENAFVGRLGNYLIGENLDERIIQRNRGPAAMGTTINSRSSRSNHLNNLKSVAKVRPSILEPLPVEIRNQDVQYKAKP